MTNNITTFSYFSEEEYEKLKQITKTLKEENTKASQSMLIRVAFNELINNKTIKQINEYLEEEGMVDNSNINYFDEEGNIDMYKAIDLLDIYQKNVVVLFYFYNLTYKEVGDILDMNESTVKMYLRNSLKIMKEIIKEGGLHGKEEL